jgi:hypothetical protein
VPILESAIEKYLRIKVVEAGGVCEKVQAIGGRGFFDRIVVLPGGRIYLVEVKKPKGGRLSPHQRAKHDLYRGLGVAVTIIKTVADVDRLIDSASFDGVQKRS